MKWLPLRVSRFPYEKKCVVFTPYFGMTPMT
jgi:hypothetical protein